MPIKLLKIYINKNVTIASINHWINLSIAKANVRAGRPAGDKINSIPSGVKAFTAVLSEIPDVCGILKIGD